MTELIKLKSKRKTGGMYDNAPVRTAQVAEAKPANSGFEFVPHIIYLLYVDTSDFFVFPKLKSHQRDHHLGNNDVVVCAVRTFLG